MSNVINEIKSKQKNLVIEAINNIVNLIDDLKQCEDDKYDEIEKLIKQGLYLIKYIINTN